MWRVLAESISGASPAAPTTEALPSALATNEAEPVVEIIQPSSGDGTDSTSQPEATEAPASEQPKKKKKWDPIAIPNHEQIQMQDFMDNCISKGIMSFVMGGLAGAAFGIFTASIENAGGVSARLEHGRYMGDWALHATLAGA